MNIKNFLLLFATLLAISSCKGEQQQKKAQIAATTTSEVQAEVDSSEVINNQSTAENDSGSETKLSLKEQLKTALFDSSPGDSIVGVWEVKNEYYMAVYEIIKYKNHYVGKMHYYNDGSKVIEATSDANDYFLDGIAYVNKKYTTGTMYMPDGKQHKANLVLKGDVLVVKITMNGYPYTEKWTRKNLNAQDETNNK